MAASFPDYTVISVMFYVLEHYQDQEGVGFSMQKMSFQSSSLQRKT